MAAAMLLISRRAGVLANNSHLIDCLSYILLDKPEFVNQGKPASTWRPIYPAVGY